MKDMPTETVFMMTGELLLTTYCSLLTAYYLLLYYLPEGEGDAHRDDIHDDRGAEARGDGHSRTAVSKLP